MTNRQLQEHGHRCCREKHASVDHHSRHGHNCGRGGRHQKHEDRGCHGEHGHNHDHRAQEQCCNHGREEREFHHQNERNHGHGHARHCEGRHERHGHRCEMHGREGSRGGRGGRGGGAGRGGNFNPLDGHRRIGADELQLIVLALLEEKPRHGYDIIKHLGTLTQGFYAPSPGMIYPVLTYLEESDFVSISMQGNKKCYELTEQGLVYLNEHREHVQAVMGRLAQTGQHMYRMQRSYAEEINASLSDDALHKAVRALRAILHEKHSAPDAEKERINAILMRALKEITG